MDVKEKLGVRIKTVQLANNLTQEQLAEKAVMSSHALSQLERGDNFLSAELLEKLSKALTVRPSVFFDFDCDFETRDFDVENLLIKEAMALIKNNPQKIYEITKILKCITN